MLDDVKWLSYPFAYPQEDEKFVFTFRDVLIKSGYKACVTTAIGRAGYNNDPMRLKRIRIYFGDDLSLFQAKVAGAYDWVAEVLKLFDMTK